MPVLKCNLNFVIAESFTSNNARWIANAIFFASANVFISVRPCYYAEFAFKFLFVNSVIGHTTVIFALTASYQLF